MSSPAANIETASAAPAAVKSRQRTDHHLWGTYILLVIIAIIELFSASIQEVNDGNIFRPIMRHGGFLIGGLVIMLLMQKMHYRHIYALIPLYVAGSIAMMIAVRFVGTEINGAMRAIRVAGIPVLPAEFMKLAAALGMAWILSRNQMKGRRDVTTRGLVYSLVFLYFCAGLLFSQGLSNTIVVMAIGFSMMLVGGMGWRKFGIALGITMVVGVVAIGAKTLMKHDDAMTPQQELAYTLNKENPADVAGHGRGQTWRNRVERHFRPDKHLEKFSIENQQEQLSYIAQAHGGLTGVGIGRSRENARLPLAFSDYIYAIIIEEMGLFVGLGILACYLWILGRSAKLTVCFKQTLPGVLVMGCAFVIVFQALYHMAIVSGVFPVSGQPLPLISKGGISVLVTSMAFGIMLSCARHAVRTTDTKAELRQEIEMLPEEARSANPAEIVR